MELDHDTILARINPTHTFFGTRQGYIGIGPEDSYVIEVLYVLFGGHVLYLLYETSEMQDERGTRVFVGYAHVHGIINGQALETNNLDEKVVLVGFCT